MRLMRPAQFTRMSIRPKAASVAPFARSSDARSVTSAVARIVRRPRASISAAVLSTASAVRAQATTSAPASAKPQRERASDAGGPAGHHGDASCEVERGMAHAVFCLRVALRRVSRVWACRAASRCSVIAACAASRSCARIAR